jgi:type VI secretion system protein ImpB
MAGYGTQHKLSRVRRPRVHITYDVQVGDATERKELPMVVGVLADLSGHRQEPLPPLKDRKFVGLEGENFDDVMRAMTPRVEFAVENKLADGTGRLPVALAFRGMEDFSPASIARQVPALQTLLDSRSRLIDLLAKLDGNDGLADELRKAVAGDGLTRIRAELSKGD